MSVTCDNAENMDDDYSTVLHELHIAQLSISSTPKFWYFLSQEHWHKMLFFSQKSIYELDQISLSITNSAVGMGHNGIEHFVIES